MDEKRAVENNRIFDDVFRTMVERMPWLVIPVMNEVFHTDYVEGEELIPVHNEHQTKSGEVITDSCLRIRNHTNHIECQSSPDYIMAIRMIEYDFAIALEDVTQKNGLFEIHFPKSCTLYLRHTKNTPDELIVRVYFDEENNNKNTVEYRALIVKVQEYTGDEIFRKKLLLFLPFYIMRYENQLEKIQGNEEQTRHFMEEFEEIRSRLERECYEMQRTALYTDMIELIVKVSDYILRSNEELRERMDAIMGGTVLKLRSEELFEEGMAEGIRLAKQVIFLYGKGKPVDVIALEVGISKEEVEEIIS